MNENQVSTYRTDGGEVLKKAQLLEKEETLFRKRYLLGENLVENAKQGVLMGFDSGCLGIFLHGFLKILIFIVFIFITNFKTAFTVYVVIHLSLYLVGVILKNVYRKKLSKLDDEIADLKLEYIEMQFKKYGITEDGLVYFDNGIVVGNGFASIELSRDYGDMKIFHIKDLKDYDEYIDERNKKDRVDLSENIASVKFRETFAVVAEKTKQVQAHAYLSPTMQLNLMKNEKLFKNNSSYHIDKNIIEFSTGRKVRIIWVYMSLLNTHTNLYSCLDDVDRYCIDFINMSAEVEKQARELLFLKGDL